MYHYSYVSPKQVKEKIEYYTNFVAKNNVIPGYFQKVFLAWVLHPELRVGIENEYRGVHEFLPSYRGDCRTTEFTGSHPKVIQNDIMGLIQKFKGQVEEEINKGL